MRFVRILAVLALILAGGSVSANDVSLTLHGSCTYTEFLVTNSAGGSTLSLQSGRRALELFNGGPNTIYCRLDGGTPLASTAGGRPIAAGTPWSIDAGDVIAVKCIAATAAQLTTAATAVTQCR